MADFVISDLQQCNCMLDVRTIDANCGTAFDQLLGRNHDRQRPSTTVVIWRSHDHSGG